MRVSRRFFLETAGAALVGGGLALALGGLKAPRRRAEVKLIADAGLFPEAPISLEFSCPDAMEGQRGQVAFILEGPQGRQEIPLGQVTLIRGQARLATQLTYPYAHRTAGQYDYYAVIRYGAQTLRTEAPASYAVRDFHWFC